jgi:hypothetical protein
MQRNDMALKRRVLIDGEELPGLVECSGPKDEEATIDVPGFSRLIPIKNGVKKFDPITLKYAIRRGTVTKTKLYQWHSKDEYHDLTIISTDANGIEVDRWLLRDCELPSFEEAPYTAQAPEYYSVTCIATCTSEPVLL